MYHLMKPEMHETGAKLDNDHSIKHTFIGCSQKSYNDLKIVQKNWIYLPL